MKKVVFSIVIVASLFICSCGKDSVQADTQNKVSYVRASIESPVTKATLGEEIAGTYPVLWSKGDNIFVYDFGYEWAAEFTLDNASAGSASGTFNYKEGTFVQYDCDYDDPIFWADGSYFAYYPSDLIPVDYDGWPCESSLVWKTNQEYSDMFIPMIALSSIEEEGVADFNFTNLGGLLRLSIKGTGTVRSIRLEVNENEGISGSGSYDLSLVTQMAGYDTQNYIVLDCGTGVELDGDNATDFYFSVPCHYVETSPGMYETGSYTDVKVILTATDGKTCTKTLKKDLLIERSKITAASFTASF